MSNIGRKGYFTFYTSISILLHFIILHFIIPLKIFIILIVIIIIYYSPNYNPDGNQDYLTIHFDENFKLKNIIKNF